MKHNLLKRTYIFTLLYTGVFLGVCIGGLLHISFLARHAANLTAFQIDANPNDLNRITDTLPSDNTILWTCIAESNDNVFEGTSVCQYNGYSNLAVSVFRYQIIDSQETQENSPVMFANNTAIEKLFPVRVQTDARKTSLFNGKTVIPVLSYDPLNSLKKEEGLCFIAGIPEDNNADKILLIRSEQSDETSYYLESKLQEESIPYHKTGYYRIIRLLLILFIVFTFSIIKQAVFRTLTVSKTITTILNTGWGCISAIAILSGIHCLYQASLPASVSFTSLMGFYRNVWLSFRDFVVDDLPLIAAIRDRMMSLIVVELLSLSMIVKRKGKLADV